MKFEKFKLLDVPNIYTATAFTFDGKLHIGLGPEQDGNIYLIDFDNRDKKIVGDGPGGMMSLLPVPGRNDMLVSVMGLFPPFRGLEAGIYRHSLTATGWKVERLIHLPFAHRCEILSNKGKNYLISATVSKHKNDPSDWSLPGQVYLTTIDDNLEATQWKAEPIMDTLFHNHGMLKTMINGKESICVSGVEGVFAIFFDGDSIKKEQLFDKEVSEFAFIDLDGKGENYLATIEPFHGNSFNIYQYAGNEWQKIYDSPLSFGHGLSAGMFGGEPTIAVGNRRDDSSLVLFKKVKDTIEKTVLEEATGTTQTQFFHHKGIDYLLASNQLKNEAAIYTAN